MFSARTSWTFDPAQTAPPASLDLTVSNPTEVGLSPPASALSALAAEAGARYEPAPEGLLDARLAVRDYYLARGAEVDAADVVLTASTSEAYSYLFHLLADPGDEVLVPSPSYPLFSLLAGLAGVRLVRYPLVFAGGWCVDTGAVSRAITPRTRAIVVVSPNNPTGSYLKRGELDALRATGLPLISDEVFLDHARREDPTRAPSLAAERGGLAFALSGLSKVAALPQVKLGWIVLAGDRDAVAEARARLHVVADTFLSVGAPVQHAARSLLAQSGAVQLAVRARVDANLRALSSALSGAAAGALPVEGGWCAVVRLPATRTADEWAARARARGVAVHSGELYELPIPGCVVVSLITPEVTLARGAAVLRELVDEGA